jgi:hypothetical protein
MSEAKKVGQPADPRASGVGGARVTELALISDAGVGPTASEPYLVIGICQAAAKLL